MEGERRGAAVIDFLLYTIYAMLGLLAGLVIWSIVHQYLTRDN